MRDGDGDGRTRRPAWPLNGPAVRKTLVTATLGGAVLLSAVACGTTAPASIDQTAMTTRAGGSSGTVSNSSASDHGAEVSSCRSTELSGEYLGGDGHHGSATMSFVLTNTSNRDCSLLGLPVVIAVNSAGERLASARPTGSEREVRLHPGGKGYVSLDVGFVGLDGNAHKAPCDPPAAALWLLPPSDSGHVVLRSETSVCNGQFSTAPFDPNYPNIA
jgi:hypothetical protein